MIAYIDMFASNIFFHGHVLVFGNLLELGDTNFSSKVEVPLNPHYVIYGRLDERSFQEKKRVKDLHLQKISSKDLACNSDLVIKCLKKPYKTFGNSS